MLLAPTELFQKLLTSEGLVELKLVLISYAFSFCSYSLRYSSSDLSSVNAPAEDNLGLEGSLVFSEGDAAAQRIILPLSYARNSINNALQNRDLLNFSETHLSHITQLIIIFHP